MPSGSPGAPPDDSAAALGRLPPDDEDQTGWLITFSDVALQLLAFSLIVAMTANAGDEPRTAAAGPAASRAPLAGVPAPEPPAVPVAPVRPAAGDVTPRLAAAGESLRAAVRAFGREDAVTVTVRASEMVLSLAETIGFASGSAALLSSALPILAAVRALASDMADVRIEVTGHTDDVPIESADFPSNLELSLARAARVVEEVALGAPGLRGRMVAAGYGAHRPVASNEDPLGRARNRRVEIRLVPRGADRTRSAPAAAPRRPEARLAAGRSDGLHGETVVRHRAEEHGVVGALQAEPQLVAGDRAVPGGEHGVERQLDLPVALPVAERQVEPVLARDLADFHRETAVEPPGHLRDDLARLLPVVLHARPAS